MRDDADLLPVLLDSDLLEAGWDGSVEPYPGMKVHTFAMQQLRKSILKKFQDKKDANADAAALALFLKVNEQCRLWPGLPTVSNLPVVLEVAFGEAKDFIYRLFHQDEGFNSFTWSAITRRFGFGNGSNIGSPGTDFFSKTALSTMATTDPGLHSIFVQAISEDPIWSVVESNRLKHRVVEVVRGSRLSFVPKTRSISRTICTEPTLNMMFQKGAQSVLEGLLKKSCGIDFSVQPDKNQLLAQLGSVDGRFGTIDLSSASDSMSLAMVAEMFPEEVVTILRKLRSPVAALPGGSEVELHMISSMGNAYTFPLQTILFASVVYGAYRSIGLPVEFPRRDPLGAGNSWRDPGNVAVFGDDIIVLREAYGLVCQMLKLLGFSVNVDKSFNTGDFRESCGGDFLAGHNVRGVYIQTLKTDGDVYSAINRLNRWSAQWGISLRRVIRCLLKGVRFLTVPYHEMDDAGVKVPLSLHKVTLGLSKEQSKLAIDGAVVYRCLVRVTPKIDMTDVESRPPKRLKGYFDTPMGVLMAALAGSLRDGCIVPRVERVAFRFKVRFSSSWDWIVPPRYSCSGFDERWKSFVELCLLSPAS
jgi:hypothetical protein